MHDADCYPVGCGEYRGVGIQGWGAIVVTKRVSLGFVYPDLCLYLQTVVVI